MGTFDEAARRAEEAASQQESAAQADEARRAAFGERAWRELAALGIELVGTLKAKGIRPRVHELHCFKPNSKGQIIRKKAKGWWVTVDSSAPGGEGYTNPKWFLKADGTWLRREELFGRHSYGTDGRPPSPFPALSEMPDGTLGIRDWYGKVNPLLPILERFISTEIMQARQGR